MKEETYGARDAFTIGEVNGIRPDQLEEYIGEDGYFSTMFDFSCLRYRLQEPHWGGDRMQMMQGCKEEMFAAQRQAGGRALFCNVMENHDTPRIPERFFFPEQIGFHSLSMIASMNFFLGGIVFLYQGQSIGMRDYRKKSIDEFRDFATFNLYREYQKEGMTQEEALEKLNAGSREHARTPMQWNGNRNGGFSDAEPWFDVNPDYQNLNLEMQRQNPESLHSFYKNMIAVRKRGDLENLFIYGETVPVYEEEQRIAAYDRNYDGQKVRVLCNLVEESVELACDMPISEVLLTNYAEQELQGDTIRLEPFQVLVVKH